MFDIICETLHSTAALGIIPSHGLNQTLTPDMTLMDLGIDSLGGMTILSELTSRMSLAMDDFELGADLTLGELARALNDAKAAAHVG